MKPLTTEQKSRLLRVLMVGGFCAVLLGAYIAYFGNGGRGLPCPLLLLTGMKCPACGMTRAASSILNGDFAFAFKQNALWLLYAAYVLWVIVADALVYVRRGEIQILPGQRWVHAAMLAVVILYGILRNIL